MKNSILALTICLVVSAQSAFADSWGTCYYNGRKHANTVQSATNDLAELQSLCARQRGVLIQVCAPYYESSSGLVYRTYNTYFNWKYLDRVGACSKLNPF